MDDSGRSVAKLILKGYNVQQQNAAVARKRLESTLTGKRTRNRRRKRRIVADSVGSPVSVQSVDSEISESEEDLTFNWGALQPQFRKALLVARMFLGTRVITTFIQYHAKSKHASYLKEVKHISVQRGDDFIVRIDTAVRRRIIDPQTAGILHQIRHIRNMAYHLDHPVWNQANTWQDQCSFVFALRDLVASLPAWPHQPGFLNKIGSQQVRQGCKFQRFSWCRMAKDSCLRELGVASGRIEDAPGAVQQPLFTLLNVGGNVAHGRRYNERIAKQVRDAMKGLRRTWKSVQNNQFDFYHQLICPEYAFASAD